ncbi:hypothetical protein REA19_39770 [Prescottella equi]|nr:hypothetical protein REA19_39770 [Prescottella equi]
MVTPSQPASVRPGSRTIPHVKVPSGEEKKYDSLRWNCTSVSVVVAAAVVVGAVVVVVGAVVVVVVGAATDVVVVGAATVVVGSAAGVCAELPHPASPGTAVSAAATPSHGRNPRRTPTPDRFLDAIRRHRTLVVHTGTRFRRG